MLNLQVLNDSPSLNNFSNIGSKTFVGGETLELYLRLFQDDKDIRYIPASGATITLDLLKSDDTTITKTATIPFTDDRSVLQFSITDTETQDIISQNLVVKIVEGTNITFALLQSGIRKVNTSTDC